MEGFLVKVFLEVTTSCTHPPRQLPCPSSLRGVPLLRSPLAPLTLCCDFFPAWDPLKSRAPVPFLFLDLQCLALGLHYRRACRLELKHSSPCSIAASACRFPCIELSHPPATGESRDFSSGPQAVDWTIYSLPWLFCQWPFWGTLVFLFNRKWRPLDLLIFCLPRKPW